MGKKKGKKDDEKKLALAARKEAKQEKSAQKRLVKQQDSVLEDQENEFDNVLQAYKNQEKSNSATITESDNPVLEAIDTTFPRPRANATLCDVDGEKRDYFYLFGGEYFDGVSNIFLDDLLRYEVAKKEWKKVLTAPRPNPRCAHSCVSYKHSLYVFGGEFETADQYHHYRDLWKFDTHTLKWTEIIAKNPPSARSGHAAFVWKNYMVIFGGFFEALRETKWYNDVSVFNLQTETWMDVPQSRLSEKPEPRSACNFSSFGNDKILIHGGFSKMKSMTTSSETKVHSDAWVLHLGPLLHQKPPTWERWMSSSKAVSSTSPNGRAGTSSIAHKSKMLVFGGVVDSEQQHHKVDSVFYNSLMALDIERRKWFPIRVKEKTSGGGRRRRRKDSSDDERNDENDEADVQNADESSNSDDLEEDGVDPGEEEKTGWDLDMLRANMFAFVDGDGNIVYERIEEEDEEEKQDERADACQEEKADEEKEEAKEEEIEINEGLDEGENKQNEKPSTMGNLLSGAVKPNPKITSSSVMLLNPETNIPEAIQRKDPLPRINASLLAVGHILYLYGGILEVGDREVTLDDMWCVDLRKRENWECLWQGTMHKQVWRGAVFDDDDSYISTGKEDGSDDDNDDSESEEETKIEIGNDEADAKDSKKSRKTGLRQEVAGLNEKYNLDDANRTPVDGESLADFYSRTSKYWNNLAMEAHTGADAELSNKELKREGFKLAQTRFDELKPVLERLGELSLASVEKPDVTRELKKKSKRSSKR
jgi:hypothetical protein